MPPRNDRPRRKPRSPSSAPTTAAASRQIDQRIADLGDWRGDTLARVRALVLEALPDAVEEVKWRGTPVWSHGGIVCTGETYAQVVKLTFAQGAALADPKRLFNASLEGNTRRAIDLRQGDRLDAGAFRALVKAAAAHNATRTAAKPRVAAAASQPTKVRLLSGGNPQIAKGAGDTPVAAYLAAMPGWTREIGERLDALVSHLVPDVQKAVKWNSPFYGLDGKTWFLSFHVFARYVKVTFFRGTSLSPLPPGASKTAETRYLDIHEGAFDEPKLARWVKQAAVLPGERL